MKLFNVVRSLLLAFALTIAINGESMCQPTIQLGLYTSGSNVVVKAKSTENYLACHLIGVTVSIRWLNSYGVSLGAVSTACGMAKANVELTEGIYKYQKFFQSVSPVDINWAAGGEYDLMSIPVNQTGTGTGTFELIPAGFADGADPYLEVGEAGEVIDYDNPFYQNATTVALPVELVSFTVTAEKQAATLNWKTATETNNAGFDIERAAVRSPESEKKWSKVGHVDGSGTSSAPHTYVFKNKNVQSGKYAYRLKQIDRDGAFTYSQEVEAVIAVPTEFALSQNYPNPFNPATTINYSLARKGMASIKIFDITGREVKTVFEEEKEAGYYSVSVDCSSIATGVYLYRMTAVNGGTVFTDTKRFVLLK